MKKNDWLKIAGIWLLGSPLTVGIWLLGSKLYGDFVPKGLFMSLCNREATNSTPKVLRGASAKSTYTYSIIIPPEQTDQIFPIVGERSSPFDFSSFIIFESSEKWNENFILSYRDDRYSGEPLSLVDILRGYPKLSETIKMFVTQNAWIHFKSGRVINKNKNTMYCFDAYQTPNGLYVCIYYHSPLRLRVSKHYLKQSD